jgi:hypothetical protein
MPLVCDSAPCIWSGNPQVEVLAPLDSLKGERMSFDIALMAVVLAGIALSAAYVRAEYIHWRELGAAERRRESALRALHAARLSEQHASTLMPSVMKLQEFGDAAAANPAESGASISRIGAARHNSTPCDISAERRKRDRKCASQ